MRTTFDIDNKLISEVVEATNAKNKKSAIVIALKEFLRLKQRELLKTRLKNKQGFGLSLKDLEKIRQR